MAVRQSHIPRLVSILVFLCVTILCPTQAESESGVEVDGPNGVRCVPLKALFGPRIVRSPIDGGKKLRMLRTDMHFNRIENIMRAHHNCLLKTDRIRFKKSGISGSLLDNGRFRTSPMDTVFVETRPIHILKQHLNKMSSQPTLSSTSVSSSSSSSPLSSLSSGASTHGHSLGLSGAFYSPALQSQSIQLEPIDVEMINDSDRSDSLPSANDWIESFDVNNNDDRK